jgi:hypothetical protein
MGIDSEARRLKRIPIDPRSLFDFLKSGNKTLEVSGFPADAQFRGVSFDAVSNSWQMFIEHESFEHVPPYEVVPELVPRVRIVLNSIE